MKKLFYIAFLCCTITASAQQMYSWESGTLSQGIFSLFSLCNPPYDAQIVTTNARHGTKAVRFELRPGDITCGGSNRAELYISKLLPISDTAEWFALSDSVPAGYASDPTQETHFQLHHSGTNGTPLWYTNLRSDVLYLTQGYDADGDGVQTVKTIATLGPYRKGKWNDYVVHYKRSTGSDGILEYWHNGVKFGPFLGPNFNLGEGPPYLKFGIYHPGNTFVATRVVYIDRVMIGGPSSKYSDFVDASIVLPPPPPPVIPIVPVLFPGRVL